MGNDPLNSTDPSGLSATTKLVKLGKALVKGEDLSSAFAENIRDARTLVNPAASALEKGIAAASLISELSPVSVGDIKDAAKVVGKVTEKLKNLKPIHNAETIGNRPDISGLPDSDLMKSVLDPKRGDFVTVNTKTGGVVDGNTRVSELQKRAADPASSISPDTEIPIKKYTPDDSAFPDLR